MEPTHPDKLVENATAPSAGGSPDGDGEDSRRGAEALRVGSGGQGMQKHGICHCLGQQGTARP